MLRIRIRQYMRSRTIYPRPGRLRYYFWLGILQLLSFVMVYFIFEYRFGSVPTFFYLIFAAGAISSFLYLAVSYTSQTTKDEFEEYTKAITDIEKMSRQLSGLITFLRDEHQKITDAEITFRELKSEQARLEPVVLTQRETVNAVLSAYTKTQATRAWKERGLGFVSGLIASLLVAALFEYLKR